MTINTQIIDALDSIYTKLKRIGNKGTKVNANIDKLLVNSALEKVDIESIQKQLDSAKVLTRRYGTTQAAEMIGVSHALIYNAESDGRLPKPVMRHDTKKATRAGYTINDINFMREYFGTLPGKPPKTRAPIIGFLNLKGGAQKTTHCYLFSQYLALMGYKVLVVDTDPQGSLSLLNGLRPDIEVSYEKTIAPFLLEDEDSLVSAGHEPGSSNNLRYSIQKTYWNRIDIIPSCLGNLSIDMDMPTIVNDARKTAEEYLEKNPDAESPFNPLDYVVRLGDGLRELSDDYDFILVDGTPSLNFSTMNVISACDMVFVPTPAAYADYQSTLSFTKLVEDLVGTYIASEIYPNLPDVRFFVAKFSNANASHFWSTVIRKVFSDEDFDDVLKNESYTTDEVAKASTKGLSIYEVTPSDADNRKRLKKDTEMFDSLFKEMHDVVWESFFYQEKPKKDFIEKMEDIQFRAENLEEELSNLIDDDKTTAEVA